MAGLRESTVQNEALAFLKKRYELRFPDSRVYGAIEVVTNERKRADGLIVVQGSHPAFTASLEAKSYRTLASMVPVIAEESWLKHGFYIIFGTYMLITALFHWLFSHWVLIYLLPILPAAIIGFGYLFLTDELVMYHTTDVVNQLRQYPANEQWLALSIDANKAIVAKDLEELKRVCLRKGVGLLIVTNKNKVVVEIEVKECNLSGKSKNFLSHYKRSKKVQLWI